MFPPSTEDITAGVTDALLPLSSKIVTGKYDEIGEPASEALVKIFDKGECCYNSPDIKDIKKFCNEQVDTLWDEVKRFENPHTYYVDLSQRLWNEKSRLLDEYSQKTK